MLDLFELGPCKVRISYKKFLKETKPVCHFRLAQSAAEKEGKEDKEKQTVEKESRVVEFVIFIIVRLVERGGKDGQTEKE